MEPLSLEMLADVFSLSKEHLSRTFKTYMDTTFKKYLTSIRVHHAYQDLMDTDLSILQIALTTVFRMHGPSPVLFTAIMAEHLSNTEKTVKNPICPIKKEPI